MSIQGLKEALAKKQSQHQPDTKSKDTNQSNTRSPNTDRMIANKPQKKASGRGR